MAVMFDAIYPSTIPTSAGVPDYAAGYIDGRWPSYTAMRDRFPSATSVSITVFGSQAAQVADCESGDLTVAQAAAWAEAKVASGVVPTIYCSFATWGAAKSAVGNIPVDWWIAAYPGIGAVVYPGSVAHQWVDRGPYDESVVVDGWVPGRSITPNITTFTDPDTEILMALAASPTDAFNAYVRDKWATYRTDGLTAAATEYLAAGYAGPWHGSIDLVLACIIDTASETGHLRPQFVGAA